MSQSLQGSMSDIPLFPLPLSASADHGLQSLKPSCYLHRMTQQRIGQVTLDATCTTGTSEGKAEAVKRGLGWS